jgi:peptide-methionine (R)-S-oxide reductase
MRLISLFQAVRTAITVTRLPFPLGLPARGLQFHTRRAVLRSMPSVPFLGALFGTSASNSKSMASYPVQKPDEEWRAVLSKGRRSHVLLRTSDQDADFDWGV